MTKLIIQHLWSDFKKHWLGILVTLVLCYIATIFVFILWILVFHGGFRSLLAFRG